MGKIYFVVLETSIAGAWSDPVDAVKWLYHGEIQANGTITTDEGETWHTIKEMADLLMQPGRDYPSIEEIILDPLNYNDVWHRDR